MRTLYFECLSGIAGDMTVAALLDAGGDKDGLWALLHSLHLHGFELSLTKVDKCGIASNYFDVTLHNEHEHNHEHEHRGILEINQIIEDSALTENAKNIAKDIFLKLAIAEGNVHGVPCEEVHFHEVGAIDSIIDIVGVAYLIDNLKVDRIISSPLYEGTGFVKCQHGEIPIPAPATAELFRINNIPFVITSSIGEQVTPTGAAIISALAQSFLPPIITNLKAIGIGAGKKDKPTANVLRVYIFESDSVDTAVTEITTAIDDGTGETLSYLSELLFEAGALDVYYTPIYMKKNRPAFQLTVLCKSQMKTEIAKIIFKHSSTIGMRIKETERIIMERTSGTVNTCFGDIKVKHCFFEDIEKTTVEFESAKAAAKEFGVSLEEVYKAALLEETTL